MPDTTQAAEAVTYRADDQGYVWKNPVTHRVGNATHITIGFRVCKMCDEVGQEAAPTIAALMNAGEVALLTAPSAPAPVEGVEPSNDQVEAVMAQMRVQMGRSCPDETTARIYARQFARAALAALPRPAAADGLREALNCIRGGKALGRTSDMLRVAARSAPNHPESPEPLARHFRERANMLDRAEQIVSAALARTVIPPDAAGEQDRIADTIVKRWNLLCANEGNSCGLGGMPGAWSRSDLAIEFANAILATRPTPEQAGREGEDAERLDWLEQAARKSRTGISFDHIPSVEGEASGFRFMRRFFVTGARKSLRSAIDEARGEVEQIQRKEAAASADREERA